MKTKKDECSYSFSNAIRTLVMVRVAGFEFPTRNIQPCFVGLFFLKIPL